ncbi:MAG TPA: DnaA/Hda family protein, partial [Herbaspirillum sp.]|nr:DnaA/Hda family protein [Herbaspirillum sp.]
MRQLLLDLGAQQAPTFAGFVTGRNAELLQRLQGIARAQEQTALHDRFVYFWGESGAGKTHLLHALARANGDSRLIAADAPDSAFDYTPAVQC